MQFEAWQRGTRTVNDCLLQFLLQGGGAGAGGSEPWHHPRKSMKHALCMSRVRCRVQGAGCRVQRNETTQQNLAV